MFEYEKNPSISSEDDNSQNIPQIPALEVNAICNILEDAIDQITILGSIENSAGTKQIQLKIDNLKTRAEKYAKNDPIYNILNGELFCHTINKMKFLKLQADRTFLEEILVQTKNELFDKSNFIGITKILQDCHIAENEEQQLITDESNNKLYASNLRSSVCKKKEESRNELHRINEKISKCKDEIETLLFDNALKLRYVENWENARIEQGFMICDQNENELIETINKYKNEIEKEIRINSEIEMYIVENQKDIEESVQNWMRRYDKELEDKQVDIQMYKEKRQEQQKRYESMLIVFEEHALAIQDFLDYKDRKQKQEELDIIWEAASIKIQAWWRGIMVRHKLGPFNPNPVRKKEKQVNKKEKKKK